MRTRIAAALVAGVIGFLGATPVLAAESPSPSTAGTPDATSLVTTDAPAGLKEYVATHAGSDGSERVIVGALLSVLVVANLAVAVIVTRKTAELDMMGSKAFMDWRRERLGVKRMPR